MSALKLSFEELKKRTGSLELKSQNKAIELYNKEIFKTFSNLAALENKKILDIGASVHGYGFLAAHEIGVAEYIGIDLDIQKVWGNSTVELYEGSKLRWKLLQMNAENIENFDEYFDAAITISTFEHFSKPAKVLDEIYRTLKQGSKFLATFEPVWTSPKGHHLHHLGKIGELFPDWGHLFMSEVQIAEWYQRKNLQNDIDLSEHQILDLIFRNSYINRLSLSDLKNIFKATKFKTLWSVDLPAEHANRNISEYLSKILPYKQDELCTKGMSILMEK